MLQAEAPPGQKVCTYCWTAKPRTPEAFRADPKSRDGLDCYCRACRRVLEKLRKRAKRQSMTTTRTEGDGA